ncbi:NUDIX domain-containing protein [Pleomorphomonas sp. NRK KF1]|uniref:NUDIX domain-containing protein n=1 Tax=Pleomorphomonas sp. NRK KF1 TaxID=2943000 RepID=UPI0020445E12|nr:NUDIX domain-containing protein [Pleomorphomonas sp. NRK KF1]MCM5553270.1 NUDIX domain-containing protein [Pleomorphomonas sp. NRK KF1]
MADRLTENRLPPVSVKERRTVYDGWLTLEVAVLETTVHGEPRLVRREVHDHGDGAAVLVYDSVQRTAILVRQVRAAALLTDGSGVTLEAIAGIVDDGEDGETAVRREAWEEAGCVVGKLEYLGRPYASPGSLTERVWLYLGEIDSSAQRGKGGGLAEESEEIEVVELPLPVLADLADNGEVLDLKTRLLVETLRRRRPELFA